MQVKDSTGDIEKQLKERGFEGSKVRQAIKHCGPNVEKCVSYMISKKKPSKPPKSNETDKPGSNKEVDAEEKSQDQLPHGYSSPLPGEVDHSVTFLERTLGFEIVPSIDGSHCCVDRRVSKFAVDNVGKGWCVAQINERWVYGEKFQTIWGLIKEATQSPPLTIKFRARSQQETTSATTEPKQDDENVEHKDEESDADDHSEKSDEASDSSLSPNHETQSPHSSFVDGKKSHIPYAHIDQDIPHDFISGEAGLRIATQSNFREDDEKTAFLANAKTLDYAGERTPSLWWMTAEQAKALQKNDLIDHRNKEGKVLLAKIVRKKGNLVQVHYEGWSSASDVWSDFVGEFFRFAPAYSVSRQPNSRFPNVQLGDSLDVNPVLVHPGWKVGEIRQIDTASGQVQLQYSHEGRECSYWAHLNNADEIAPLNEKTKKSTQSQGIKGPSSVSEKSSPSRIADNLSKHSLQNSNCNNNNNNNNHNNNNNNNRNAYNHHNNSNNRNNNNRNNNHHNNSLKKKKKTSKHDDDLGFENSETEDDDSESSDSKPRKKRRRSSKKSSDSPLKVSSEINVAGNHKRRVPKKDAHNARSQSFANHQNPPREASRQKDQANKPRKPSKRDELSANNKSRVENDIV